MLGKCVRMERVWLQNRLTEPVNLCGNGVVDAGERCDSCGDVICAIGDQRVMEAGGCVADWSDTGERVTGPGCP